VTGKIRTEIRLMGHHLDFSAIDSQIGVAPTKTWKEGERSGPDRPSRQYDCWLFSTGRIETVDIADALKVILNALSDKRAAIRELVISQNMDVSFDVELIFPADSPPALYFHRDFLDFLDCIKARVDVDIYCETLDHPALLERSELTR